MVIKELVNQCNSLTHVCVLMFKKNSNIHGYTCESSFNYLLSMDLYLICCRKLHFVLVALIQEMAQTLKKKTCYMSSVKAAQWTVKWPSKQADGRQASYSGEWMETGTSTFLDSDWPSFRSTVHLLSPSLSLALSSFPTIPLFAVEQPNKSCKVNIKVCSQRSPDLS